MLPSVIVGHVGPDGDAWQRAMWEEAGALGEHIIFGLCHVCVIEEAPTGKWVPRKCAGPCREILRCTTQIRGSWASRGGGCLVRSYTSLWELMSVAAQKVSRD